jgi:ADP-heptose:LPS heptosyltransferase
MKRVLVVRNDKLGDFMLSWPALALLKRAGCHVSVLVPAYTEPMAKLCPWVDDILVDPGRQAPYAEEVALLERIGLSKFDAAIALYSDWRNAVLLRQAKVPYRLAPATKFAQILYTKRLMQRRSRSEKPEWAYNLDLAAQFLKDQALPMGSVSPPYLTIPAEERQAHRHQLAGQCSLNEQARWVMVHPGSGGSANNLSMAQYESLVIALAQHMPDAQFLLTAGPDEQSVVGTLLAQLITHRVPVAMVTGLPGLQGLTRAISAVDLFVAGSTGPLHMAGALNVPTVGFYTRRRSATALRWQTLNTPERRLAFSPDENSADPEDFSQLNMTQVAKQISQWLPART